jgi:hypothetical protein
MSDFIELTQVTAMHFQQANAGAIAMCTDDKNLNYSALVKALYHAM